MVKDRIRVVLWESPHAQAQAALEQQGFEVCGPEDAGAASAQALVTITRPVDRAVLERFAQLRFVAVAFTGYDAVDLAACRERGVSVANVPEYATAATAELALAMMLAALRHLPQSHAQLRNGKWSPLVGRELSGKTVGIVGTGRIGLHLARLLQPFSVRLLGWARNPCAEFTASGGVYCPSIRELCARSDLVSLHLALNPQTRGIIGDPEIRSLRPRAWLVNVARGALVDENALHAALKSGALGGAALDVYSKEPFTGAPPFHELENVILLPHLGFRTAEALERRLQTTLENLCAFRDGARRNLVT